MLPLKKAKAPWGESSRRRRTEAKATKIHGGEGDPVWDAAALRISKKKRSSAPAPPPASRAHPGPGSGATSSLADVTVEDAEHVLDCAVCFLPLKPPIFQCGVGHVVCSPCHGKLKATGKCYLCGVDTGSYLRSHAMDRLVDSIHVPCPYAAHGCAERPVYHDRERHHLACVHAPCHCPGKACRIVGSIQALLDHFSASHRWPCNTNAIANIHDDYTVRLYGGFNFLLADAECPTGYKKQGATDTDSVQCLLLLTMARQPHARIISVHCIDPHGAASSGSQGPNAKEMECNLSYSLHVFFNSLSGVNQSVNHYQTSWFRVACTDLSSGLPKSDDVFKFVLSDSVIGDHGKDGIKVNVRIIMK